MFAGLMPYLLAGSLLATVAAGGIGYFKGRADSNANCRASELQAEIAVLTRDIKTAKEAEAIEDRLMAELDAGRNKIEQEVTDYEAELASRPADQRCSLDQRDIERLSGHGQR